MPIPVQNSVVLALVAMLAAGCASSAASLYPQLPTASAAAAGKGLSPADQQKIIDDLNAAKTKSEQQAASQ